MSRRGRNASLIPIEQKLGRRIASDVSYILRNRWADKISYEDFNHGHLCSYGRPPVGFERTGYEALTHSFIPVIHQHPILYHTHELDGVHSTKRNIISHFGHNPRIITPSEMTTQDMRRIMEESRRMREEGTCTVTWQDLDLTLMCDVDFELDPNGPYQLSDGRRLGIYALADGIKRDETQDDDKLTNLYFTS